MTLVALDLNATRIRACCGQSRFDARSLPLGGTSPDLPMAISLEGRNPEVGRAGVALCRRSPHLVCTNFLPQLGEAHEWAGPRVNLTAAKALALIFDQVHQQTGRHSAATAAFPGYLYPEQVSVLIQIAERARLKVHGAVDLALPAALAAHSLQPWTGLALVADVDDHAVTWSAVSADGTLARLLHSRSDPQLGLVWWKDRLLASISDAFIRKSRRDPRDSAESEQTLYDQLDAVLQACAEGFQAEVAVRSPQWYQNLVLGPQDLVTSTSPLRDRAMATFSALCGAAAAHGTPRVVVLTPAAARLPGLVHALELYLADLSYPESGGMSDDFGEGLLDDETTPPHVQVLSPTAIGETGLELAERIYRGVLQPGHLEVVPLLDPLPPFTGAPRLRFRGQELPLGQGTFSLGRDPRCNLVMDTTEYPSVSAHHCEIFGDYQGFTLIDRSKYGTLINDRPIAQQRVLQPGDWIRLGPGGPLLRFLGKTPERRG